MNLPSEAVLYMIELVLSRKKLGFDEKPSFVIYGVGVTDGVMTEGVRGVLVTRVGVGVTRLTGIVSC